MYGEATAATKSENDQNNGHGYHGCLAQLVRATRLHRVGQGFESLSIHHEEIILNVPQRCRLPVLGSHS